MISGPVRAVAEVNLMNIVDNSLFADNIRANTSYSDLDKNEREILRADLANTIQMIASVNPEFIVKKSEEIESIHSSTAEGRYSDVVYDEYGIAVSRKETGKKNYEITGASGILTVATADILSIRRLGGDISIPLDLTEAGLKSISTSLDKFYALQRLTGELRIVLRDGQAPTSPYLIIFSGVVDGIGVDLGELGKLVGQKTKILRKAYDLKARSQTDFLRKIGSGNIEGDNNKANELIRQHFPNVREIHTR